MLGYLEYRNFKPVITKAKEACKNSNQDVLDHFVELHEMVKIGSGTIRTAANQTHYEVGKTVRKTIKELGGTMPEDLPTADSIKKLEKGKETKKVKGKKP